MKTKLSCSSRHSIRRSKLDRTKIASELVKIAEMLVARKQPMIFIINSGGARWCRDKRWRSFANYGSGGSSVKEYRNLGQAKRVAEKLKAKVVLIEGEEYSVDASGRVIKKSPIPNKPNYEKVTHHDLEDFVVYSAN